MPVRTVEISARQQDGRRLDRTQNISVARQKRKLRVKGTMLTCPGRHSLLWNGEKGQS
jgi:hypothetical protein